jgi:hypothetical protein
MKKLVFAAIAALGLSAGAAEANLTVSNVTPEKYHPAGSWTPVCLNLVTPVGLPWGFDWSVRGFAVGLWNQVDDMVGLEIGVVNVNDFARGLQIGVVNVTRREYGMQIGVVNVIQDNDVSFLPVINWYF